MAKVLVKGINRRLDKVTNLSRLDLVKCRLCGCQFVPDKSDVDGPTMAYKYYNVKCPNSTCNNTIELTKWQKKAIQ